MNENFQENFETVEEIDTSISGVSDNMAGDSWNGGTSVSSGDSGQTVSADVSGNEYPIVTAESSDSVSDNDIYTLYAGTGEDVQYLAEISQGINTLNGTVTLLFFFLLMAWAEKKINTVVRRFSEKKR